MKVKTADLIGPALDWAVAKCEGHEVEIGWYGQYIGTPMEKRLGYLIYLDPPERDEFGEVSYSPSTDWAKGGPLIQQECLEVRVFAEHGAPDGGPYWISERHPTVGHGPTPLIAALRCLVAATLGDEVDIPDELV